MLGLILKNGLSEYETFLKEYVKTAAEIAILFFIVRKHRISKQEQSDQNKKDEQNGLSR